jgi:predicted molibdopterin-dependent oxidoreductase YjgC
MFDRLDPPAGGAVRFRFDGVDVEAHAGDTIAAALLAAGIDRFRASAVTGTARGPWCLMGACGDCLVAIAGRGRRRACATPVEEGLEVSSAAGVLDVGGDA